MVIYLDKEQQKISLSTKKLEREPGDMLRDPQRVYEEAEAMAAAYRERLEVQWPKGGAEAAAIIARLAWGPHRGSASPACPVKPTRVRFMRAY
jgi:hypothetical protein